MSEFGCDDQYRWETDNYVCVWNCLLDNYSRKCLEDRADPLGICCENIVEFRRKPKPASDREAALRAECDKLKVQRDAAQNERHRLIRIFANLTKERDEARKIARELAEFVRNACSEVDELTEKMDWLA